VSFDLTAAIQDELRAGTTFHDVASRVFERIPVEDHGAALSRTLPLLVKRVQRDMENVPNAREANKAKRVCLRKGVWKYLNDCTARDIRSVADEQRGFSEVQAMWGARYDHLADAMEQQDAHTVAELDPDLIHSILN
jgi:hypothetical protein